ncbi:hypothetical protein BGY98DRAFT_300534 [Russula aff. rugulosa BPL654]|nr:hypothetical protein BGY98DRAFT_300534 [Russula aff. rugulosa BPL654]
MGFGGFGIFNDANPPDFLPSDFTRQPHIPRIAKKMKSPSSPSDERRYVLRFCVRRWTDRHSTGRSWLRLSFELWWSSVPYPILVCLIALAKFNPSTFIIQDDFLSASPFSPSSNHHLFLAITNQ